MRAQKSAFELERDARVAANAAKIAELGLAESAKALAPTQAKPAKTPRQKRAKIDPECVETRRSERPRTQINYSEFEAGALGGGAGTSRPRDPVDYSARIATMTLDAQTAEQLRLEMEAKRAAAASSSSGGKSRSSNSGKSRGPVDSGKGVRIQGGKVYDSKHGVTCHWCRQKTLEDHVTCTNANCGGGRRMPMSFCARCLKNRHGEDFEAADASGGWWCPLCRGSCGAGCVTCCNCGPCRKKAGLEPTHQVAKLAREAGFTNVHDYLVHLVTSESPEVIAARKLTHRWGAWLKGDGGSEASEQTEGGVAEQQQQQQEDGEEEPDEAAPRDTSGRRGARKAGRGRRGAGRSAATAAGSKRKAAAAPAAAAEEGDAQDARPPASPPVAATPPAQQQKKQQGDDDDAPMLSSQDSGLTRKQRIMQRLGLAPVTVCDGSPSP